MADTSRSIEFVGDFKRSDPWYEDGSIVLETEGTQFKVYKGILAAASSVFKDLFSFAQGESDQMVEDSHVVQLSDKAEDLRIVLNSLRDSTMYVLLSAENHDTAVLTHK